ncbi:hypothetical protein AYI68_g7685 [Smittium mucronatum]|uniref:Uncharacterized protein n=1 Tax=Smittium mucronatum TaxID=133383 RepID=A0A1R0GN13_9FUNG|nr:hypothetical protein AYI68_g7685 [Smittium mucronatum]
MEKKNSPENTEYVPDIVFEANFDGKFEEVNSSFSLDDETKNVSGGRKTDENTVDLVESEKVSRFEKQDSSQSGKRSKYDTEDEPKKKKKRISDLTYEEQADVIRSIGKICKDFSFTEFSSKFKAMQKISEKEIILDIKLKTLVVKGFAKMPVNELKVSLKNLRYDMSRIFFIKYEGNDVKMVIERSYLEELEKFLLSIPKLKIYYV